MPFNGSGVFTRLYNWTNDAAANIKIRADRSDNELDGIATGLSTCITKDGQTTITANLPMSTYRHTGVGDGASRTDYTSVGQTQDGKINWVAAGGTADAITATYSIPVTALVDGQLCYVRASAANATTTPTFSPNGLTARTITKTGGNALDAGDIAGAGHEIILRYKLSSTRWELLNPAPSASVTDATITTTDVTTNNVSSTKHGWAPKSPADATKFLNGAATPAYAAVKDSDLSLSDITTNNASASNHGFLKKLSNSASDVLTGDGNWTASSSLSTQYSATAASTSGTEVAFTSLPSTKKQFTLTLEQVSTNGTGQLIVQLGSVADGGYVTANYKGQQANLSAAPTAISSGFAVNIASVAAGSYSGSLIFTNITGNKWACQSVVGRTDTGGTTAITMCGGSIALSGALDRIRLYAGGTDTFDAGTVGIVGI